MSEGAITYPRTYGVRGRKAWKRGRYFYLSIGSRGLIIEYVDWTFKTFIYAKRLAPIRASLRRVFDTRAKSDFLKHIAANEGTTLEAAGFSAAQIDAMAKGIQPRGYSVHHKLPLDDGGDNSYANLLLIRESPEHAALTAYQNSVMQGLRDGEARETDFPVPERDMFVYPPTNDPPTTRRLWPTKNRP